MNTCSNCGLYKRKSRKQGLCKNLANAKYFINTSTGKREECLIAVHRDLTCVDWRKRNEYAVNVSRARTGKVK